MQYHELKVADLPGLSLNYLQVIFIIFRLKTSFDPVLQRYRHTEVFDELPAALDKIYPSVKEVFIKTYDERNDPQHSARAMDIKELIIRKIIPDEPEPPLSAMPVIEAFSADVHTIESGGTFVLRWIVKDADTLELYKNGILDEAITGGKTNLTKTAYYDGGSKTISYKLIAHKEDKQAESKAVEISVKEKPIIPAPSKKALFYYIKLVAIPLLVLLFIVLLLRRGPMRAAEKPVVSGINVENIYRQYTVTIYGRNLAVNKNEVTVLMDNVPARLELQSGDSLVVSYPFDGAHLLSEDAVSIGIIINNDTVYTARIDYSSSHSVVLQDNVECTSMLLHEKSPDGISLYAYTLRLTDSNLVKKIKSVDYYPDKPSYSPKLASSANAQNNFSYSFREWTCFDTVSIYLHYKDSNKVDSIQFPMCEKMKKMPDE